MSKSNNSTTNKGVEYLSFNDYCVITPMDSMDTCEEETSSILEVTSSKLSKSTINSNSSYVLEYLPIYHVIINNLVKYLKVLGFYNVAIDIEKEEEFFFCF